MSTFRLRPPVGSAPDALMKSAQADPTSIRLIQYSKDHYRCVFNDELKNSERSIVDWIESFQSEEHFLWVDIEGLENIDQIKHIAEHFNIHALTVADIVQSPQLPKVDFDKRIFVLTHGFGNTEKRRFEQFSVVFGRRWVISFRESAEPQFFSSIRKRMEDPESRFRQHEIDYLVYAILDVVVDTQFEFLDSQNSTILNLEEQILDGSAENVLAEVQQLRKVSSEHVRVLRAQRKAITRLVQEPNQYLTPDTRIYFDDVVDHANEQLSLLEHQSELIRGLRELHLSMLNQRLNEVMRFLTLISTIFIPLSFLAGVYGMNFATENSVYNMPELRWRYGYFAWWGLVIAIAITMTYWFKRRGWLDAGS